MLNYKNGILFLSCIVIWGLPLSNTMGADNAIGITKIHDGVRTVEDDGPIMFVDNAKKSIIVKERQIVVGQYWADNLLHTTQLVDGKGNQLDFNHFEAGMWVLIRGYSVTQNRIYAKWIQSVGQGTQRVNRNINRVIPLCLP